jgi:hypothetical protein
MYLLIGAGAIVLGIVAAGIGVSAQAGLAGTWKINLTKSKFSPGPAPKSMTVTYTPSAKTLRIVVDVVPGDGAKQHWEMSANVDGSEGKITGNPAADTVSFKTIDANTSESTFTKDGKVTSVNRRSLSADGKTLTVESKGTTADGKPRHDIQVFEK